MYVNVVLLGLTHNIQTQPTHCNIDVQYNDVNTQRANVTGSMKTRNLTNPQIFMLPNVPTIRYLGHIYVIRTYYCRLQSLQDLSKLIGTVHSKLL